MSSCTMLGDERRKAFLQAAVEGDVGRLRAMVAEGPEVLGARSTSKGYGALHFAAERGQWECVVYLTGECAVDVDERTNDGFTPAQLAAGRRHARITDYLLARSTHPRPLSGHPPEVYHNIAGYLDVRSTLSLASTSRATRSALWRRLNVRRVAQRLYDAFFEVNDILYHEWAPINFYGLPEDEYSRYVLPVIDTLCKKGVTVSDIEQRLAEVEEYGWDGCVRGDKAGAAESLIALGLDRYGISLDEHDVCTAAGELFFEKRDEPRISIPYSYDYDDDVEPIDCSDTMPKLALAFLPNALIAQPRNPDTLHQFRTVYSQAPNSHRLWSTQLDAVARDARVLELAGIDTPEDVAP